MLILKAIMPFNNIAAWPRKSGGHRPSSLGCRLIIVVNKRDDMVAVFYNFIVSTASILIHVKAV